MTNDKTVEDVNHYHNNNGSPSMLYVPQPMPYYPQVVIVQAPPPESSNMCLLALYYIFLSLITASEFLFFGLFVGSNYIITISAYSVLFVITIVSLYGITAKNEPCLIIVAALRLGWVLFISLIFAVIVFLLIFSESDYEYDDEIIWAFLFLFIFFGLPVLFYLFFSVAFISTAIKIAILFHKKKALVNNSINYVQNIEMSSYDHQPNFV